VKDRGEKGVPKGTPLLFGGLGFTLSAIKLRNEGRDVSTAVELRLREAQSSLNMTRVLRISETVSLLASGAKARMIGGY
jgi:hypothetical protein